MKQKNKKKIINLTSSTEFEINGEKIISGFESKKNKKPINAIESLENELFKKKKAIVKLNNKNKVMSINGIEIFLISQAMAPIQHEVSIGVLNAFSSAYNRFKEWKKSLSNAVKLLLWLMIIPFMSFCQDISGNWVKKTDYSTFNLSFTPINNTDYYAFDITGNTYAYDPITKDTINFPAHIGLSYIEKDSFYVVSFKKIDTYLYGYYNDKASRDKESYDELYLDDEDPCQFEFYVFNDSVLVNAHPICNFIYGGFRTNFIGTYLK
tara:strand:- start:109 stop:906 length:798 start_codon:yes stop_codon:yes gene_type:complete